MGMHGLRTIEKDWSPANKSQALKQENFEGVKKGIKTKSAKGGFFADHISCKF